MKIPFLYRCILYFIISMVMSPYYDGWSSTAKYLISEGVFTKYCSEAIKSTKPFGVTPLCDEQAFNIGNLLSFYRISEFLSSIFIGLFMDNIGPKITIVLSIVFRLVSWMLIPLFRNSTGVIIFSCILCGIATNGVLFPILTIAQYTKRYYNASMILISVSLCIGTFYTFMLNFIKKRLPDYNPVYVIAVKLALTHLPLLIASIFIFPNSLENDVKLNASEESDILSKFCKIKSGNVTDPLKSHNVSNTTTNKVNSSGESVEVVGSEDNVSYSQTSQNGDKNLYKYASDDKVKSNDVEMASKESLVFARSNNIRTVDAKSDTITEDVQSDGNMDNPGMYVGSADTPEMYSGNTPFGDLGSNEYKAGSNTVDDDDGNKREKYAHESPETLNTKLVTVNSSVETEPLEYQDVELMASSLKGNLGEPNAKWVLREFLLILRRVDILVISFASIVCVISLTYSQESFTISYANDDLALYVNEIMIPLSFVFSIGSVFLLDRYGSVPIIVGLNLMSALLHLTMMFTNRVLSIFTSVLLSLGYSLFMTQYYLYLDGQVPITYQGSVKGFLVTSIGLILFVNIGLNHLSKTYFYTREIHLALMIVRLLVTIPLVMFLKRTKVSSGTQDLTV